VGDTPAPFNKWGKFYIPSHHPCAERCAALALNQPPLTPPVLGEKENWGVPPNPLAKGLSPSALPLCNKGAKLKIKGRPFDKLRANGIFNPLNPPILGDFKELGEYPQTPWQRG